MLEERWGELVGIAEHKGYFGRVRANQFSWLLASAKPDFGWGADSYRHVVGLYQKEMRAMTLDFKKHRNRKLFVQTHMVAAHNDPLQWLVELGRYGILPMVGITLFYLVGYLRNLFRTNLMMVNMGSGMVLLVAHSFWDLIFLSGTLVIWGSFLAVTLLRCGSASLPSVDETGKRERLQAPAPASRPSLHPSPDLGSVA